MSGRDDGGRPKALQSKLSEAFLPALLDDFAEHGAAAIERVRQADPAGYLRIVASVIPKHLAIDDASELNADRRRARGSYQRTRQADCGGSSL